VDNITAFKKVGVI